jgi:hypothetical protein
MAPGQGGYGGPQPPPPAPAGGVTVPCPCGALPLAGLGAACPGLCGNCKLAAKRDGAGARVRRFAPRYASNLSAQGARLEWYMRWDLVMTSHTADWLLAGVVQGTLHETWGQLLLYVAMTKVIAPNPNPNPNPEP